MFPIKIVSIPLAIADSAITQLLMTCPVPDNRVASALITNLTITEGMLV